jgi:rRNA processing protein Gar1
MKEEKPNIKKSKEVMKEEDDSSEWSLESLEDMKGINIRSLEEENDHVESKPREKPSIQPKFPEKPSVFITAALHEIGKVIFIVGELLIVQAQNGSFVVDLDNWVADSNRNLIGFVIDVLGRIENPYYAVKLEDSTSLSQWLGSSLYYIEGTSKILKDEDIKSLQSKSAAEVE